jgi:hypothetical protein
MIISRSVAPRNYAISNRIATDSRLAGMGVELSQLALLGQTATKWHAPAAPHLPVSAVAPSQVNAQAISTKYRRAEAHL